MNRWLDAAGAVGASALIGMGVAPFLHRPDAPQAWFQLRWPRDLDEDGVRELLRHLASTRRPAVVTFELHASRGHIAYFLGVARVDVGRLRHLCTVHIPDVLLDPADHPQVPLRRAVSVRLGTRERALRTNSAMEIARSVIGAATSSPSTTVVQLQLGTRLAPSHVPQDSVGLPSTSRALTQAAHYGLKPLDAKARTELQTKVGEHGFRTTLRIGSSAPDRKAARAALQSVVGGLRVAESPGVALRVRASNADAISRGVPAWSAMALNVLELVGLLGWPLGDSPHQGLERVRSRRLPVPDAVPSAGRVIGEGTHPQTTRPVAQTSTDACTGTLLLGVTGSGKSTLAAQMILSSLKAGEGVIVIDPKAGDLVNEVLARVPPHRVDDIVIMDPADTAPVGINPLQGRSPELAADALVSLLSGIYPELGPRTTDILFASVSALAAHPGGTLAALPVLLRNARYRREVTKDVRGEQRAFWQWFEQLNPAERANVCAPLNNKIRALLRPALRAVLAQPEPKFRIDEVFTKRRALLVALDQAKLGAVGTSLLSSILVAETWRAVQTRGSLKPSARRIVSIYLDEFQLMIHGTTDFEDVLARSRSYKTGWTVANQHLAQLTPSVRAGVLANARSKIVFRVSAEDAAILARTTDRLDAADFQNLGRYEVYTSLVAYGETQPYCSATTQALPDATADAEEIRARSRERYGADRALTEAAIQRLWDDNPTAGAGMIGSRRRPSTSERRDGDES